MPELNPNTGDSNQEGNQQPTVQEPVIQEPVKNKIVEPAQAIEQKPEFDLDDLSQKLMDKIFPQIGDGVKTIVENQVSKSVESALKNINTGSQVNLENTVQKTEPVMVKTHTDLEKLKEPVVNNDLDAMKARIAELEAGDVENAIRSIPVIKQLSEISKTDSERFIARAKAIANANNIRSSEVSRIFEEGQDIARDVNNQIVILSQGNTNVVNKPINKPINTDTTPKPNKWALINEAMLGKK